VRGGALALHRRAADNTADEADVAFSLGNQAYGKRDYEKALSAYLLSNRLCPTATCCSHRPLLRALDKYDEAFRYYFELSSEQLATDDAREVRQALARLTPKVALLTVSSEPGDADVYVDREDLGSRGRTR